MKDESNDYYAEAVIKAAASRGVKIATAESCTCGVLVALLAGTPGAGEVMLGGFVCYDRSFKTTVLRVPGDVIRSQTAVSERVAEAMAQGALDLSGAELSVAITGVAGPDEDEDGNPVGLAYLAVVGSNGQRRILKLELPPADPEVIKNGIVLEALKLMEGTLKRWTSMATSPERFHVP